MNPSLTIFLLFFPFFGFAEPLSLTVAAESAILVNADTGTILFQKKPKMRMYPASLTKIATILYALKVKGNDLDEIIVAEQDCIGSVSEEEKQRSNYSLPSYWLVTDCSHMGIKKGEKLALRDLIYGTMIVSADDASNMIAYALGNHHIPRFMEELNGYLKSLGCYDTFFNNPHGLYHPKHVTTAYDLSLMAREAMKNPLFRTIVATKRYTRPKTNKQDSAILIQTNKLLRPGELFYPKAIGIKTGYISKAGNTLVAAAKEGDRTLIAVLLNVKERKDIFKDAIRLFEAAFNQPKVEKILIKAGDQKYLLDMSGASSSIRTYVKEDVTLSYYPAEEPKVRAFLLWDKVVLPIKKGQRVGELHLKTDENRLIQTVPLYAGSDVFLQWHYQLKKLFVHNYLKIVIGIALLLVLYGIWRFLRK